MDDDSADDPLDGPRDGPIDGEAQEDAGPVRRISTLSSRDAVTVEVGTSALCTGTFATQVSQMVNEAYGYGRLSPGEVRQELVTRAKAGLQSSNMKVSDALLNAM